MKAIRKGFAWVLALAMLISCMSLSIFAEDTAAAADPGYNAIFYVGTYQATEGEYAAGRQKADLAMPDTHVGAFATTITDEQAAELNAYADTLTAAQKAKFLKESNGIPVYIISDTIKADEQMYAFAETYGAVGNAVKAADEEAGTLKTGTGYGYEEMLTCEVGTDANGCVNFLRVKLVGNQREYGYTGPTSESGPTAGEPDTTDEYGVFRNFLPRMIGMDISENNEDAVEDILDIDTVTSATITCAAVKHSVVEAEGLQELTSIEVDNWHDLAQAVAYIGNNGTIEITGDIAAGLDIGWDLGDDEIAACDDGIVDAVTCATIGQIKFDRNVTINGNGYNIHAASYAELVELYGDDAWTDLSSEADTAYSFYVSGSQVTINDWTIEGAAYGYHQGGAIYVDSARGPQKIMSAYNRDAEKEEDEDEEDEAQSGKTSSESTAAKGDSGDESASGGEGGSGSQGSSGGQGGSGGQSGSGGRGGSEPKLTLNNVTIKNSASAAINGATEVGSDGNIKTTLEESKNGGGAVLLKSGTLVAENCNFEGNTTVATDVHTACEAGVNHDALYGENGTKSADQDGRGGAIYCSGGNMTLKNCTFTDNSGLYGGAIAIYGGTADIQSCTFADNNGVYGGDDIYVYGTATVTTSDLTQQEDGTSWKDCKNLVANYNTEDSIEGFTALQFVDSTRYVPVSERFTDVDDQSYYAGAVAWAVNQEIVYGTSENTFSPEEVCSRGQIVAMLWRQAGSPEPTLTESPFTDISSDEYWYEAVLWAYENEITYGTSATTFSPEEACTRGQIVSLMWRAAGSSESTLTENPFVDVSQEDYWYEAVLWAYENGVTYGTSADKFSPEEDCTRSEFVSFLYRTK